jgi:hypothetical protein
MNDFGLWQRCYTGPGNTALFNQALCDCLDRNDTNGDGFFDPVTDGDNAIDGYDFSQFLRCVSGAGVPANPACAD